MGGAAGLSSFPIVWWGNIASTSACPVMVYLVILIGILVIAKDHISPALIALSSRVKMPTTSKALPSLVRQRPGAERRAAPCTRQRDMVGFRNASANLVRLQSFGRESQSSSSRLSSDEGKRLNAESEARWPPRKSFSFFCVLPPSLRLNDSLDSLGAWMGLAIAVFVAVALAYPTLFPPA